MNLDKIPEYSAIVFDLDGTLLDTLTDLADAMNAALARRGYPTADVATYRRRVGWGLRAMVRRSLPPDDAERTEIVDAIAREFREIHFSDPVRETRPYPGIPALVGDLVEAGVPLFVNTNKPDAIAGTVIDACLPPTVVGTKAPPFRRVLGQRDDVPRKPDPAGVLMMLRDEAIEPGGVVYVGDSEIDIETARSAGCVPVGVSWGFRDVESLRAAGAEYICYSVDDLRRRIGVPTPQGGRE